jgi:hypothetical protein
LSNLSRLAVETEQNTWTKGEKRRQRNKNKTIADCIKLNNLKISQFYVGNLRITTFYSTRMGGNCLGEGSTLWRGFSCLLWCRESVKSAEVFTLKDRFFLSFSEHFLLFNWIRMSSLMITFREKKEKACRLCKWIKFKTWKREKLVQL